MSAHDQPPSCPPAIAGARREPHTPRRDFLGQVLRGGAVLAAAAAAKSPLLAQSTSTAPDGPGHASDEREGAAGRSGPYSTASKWDMSWTERIAGRHKQVFDAPEIADGTVLHQARMFFNDYREVYGAKDEDISAVLVIRHAAVPMIFGDTIWERYEFIGRVMTKLQDPTTGKPARRNPFLKLKPQDKHLLVWPDAGLDNLIRRGAIVLACNLALMGRAQMIAARTKQSSDDVMAELRDTLVPGVTLMPSGIFAVTRAQEAGCNYIRAA